MATLTGYYSQSKAPGVIDVGTIWNDTGSGKTKILNDALDWVDLYRYNRDNGGLYPLSGGDLHGPIVGAHGLVPVSEPAMSGTATLGGIKIATKDDLKTSLTTLTTRTSASSGTTTTPDLPPYSIAVASGISVRSGLAALEHDLTSKIPSYADGVTATIAETKCFVSIEIQDDPDSPMNEWIEVSDISDASTLKYKAVRMFDDYGEVYGRGLSLNYLIISIRKN